MVLKNTFAAANLLKKDINRIVFITTIFVQVVFLCFYGYSIYSNSDDLFKLIVYSTLLFLSLFSFVYYLVTINKQSKVKNKLKRFVRVFKYLVNGSMLGVNIYFAIVDGSSNLQTIILIISGISLIIQIIVELLKVFFDKYIELFGICINKDLGFLLRMKEVKGNFYEFIDAPLEKIANKLDKESYIKTKEYKVEEMTKKYVEEQKQQKKQKKKEKKERTKRRSNENAAKQKKEIKEHIKTIKDHIIKQKEKVK